MTRIAICGVGSVWTARIFRAADSSTGLRRPLYYNSTAVETANRVQSCPVVYGVVRFSSAAVIQPHAPHSFLGQVFLGHGVRVDTVRRQLTVESRGQGEPQAYLIAMRSPEFGPIDRSGTWRSAGVEVISFSEAGAQQEVLLLMKPFSWVRTTQALYTLGHPVTRSQLRAGVLQAVR